MPNYNLLDVYVNEEDDGYILIFKQDDRERQLYLSTSHGHRYTELKKDTRSLTYSHCQIEEKGYLKDYSSDLDHPAVYKFHREGDTITVFDMGKFVKREVTPVDFGCDGGPWKLPSDAYCVDFCLRDGSDDSMYVYLWPKFREETGSKEKLIRVDSSGKAYEYPVVYQERFRDGGTTNLVFNRTERTEDCDRLHILHYDTPFNTTASRQDFIDDYPHSLDVVKVDDELFARLKKAVKLRDIRITTKD